MAKIQRIDAMEILDSRGNPTVQVSVFLDDMTQATAAVPSGASTGAYEAYELRDDDMHRYGGKGVTKAVENINSTLAKVVSGMDVSHQRDIDEALIDIDGTPNKKNIGANAILGVSLAVCRAAALSRNIPLYQYIHDTFFPSQRIQLPIPMFNILNGGKHADSGLCIQEFKIVPLGIRDFAQQLRAGSEVFHILQSRLAKEGYATGVGDEGGFAPKLKNNEHALKVITEAIQEAGYVPGKDVRISLDVAANSFYDAENDRYELKPEGEMLTRDDLLVLYQQWMDRYPLLSIEDGLHEDDWEGWKIFSQQVHGIRPDIMLIGDDLLVTNAKRVAQAIEQKACDSVLIKPNQVGSVSETIDTIALAQNEGMNVVLSHRSGETVDTFISDLAVGCGAGFMKSGSLSRGERICKYNRLLEIERERASKN